MDIYIFDDLPMRVTSVEQISRQAWARPSERRLRLAHAQGEALEDALFTTRREEEVQVRYTTRDHSANEKALLFLRTQGEHYFRQHDYLLTDITIGFDEGEFTLRKIYSPSEEE